MFDYINQTILYFVILRLKIVLNLITIFLSMKVIIQKKNISLKNLKLEKQKIF